jgi:V8-like Glu-specific endopeptidase
MLLCCHGCCCCRRYVLPQNPATTAGVRQTRDGFVYYLSPKTTEASFMQAKATFLSAPVDGQTQQGFEPGAAQSAESAAMLLRSMNAGRKLQNKPSRRGSSRYLSSNSSSISSSSTIINSRSSSSNSSSSSPGSSSSAAYDSSSSSTSSSSSSSSSSQRSRSIRHIIGIDDREQLSSTPGWPYTAVGQFVFRNGSCSGVMIGPRSVLTAGHCVYNRKRKIWQEDLKFVPFR